MVAVSSRKSSGPNAYWLASASIVQMAVSASSIMDWRAFFDPAFFDRRVSLGRSPVDGGFTAAVGGVTPRVGGRPGPAAAAAGAAPPVPPRGRALSIVERALSASHIA